jgi:hypothetical protein
VPLNLPTVLASVRSMRGAGTDDERAHWPKTTDGSARRHARQSVLRWVSEGAPPPPNAVASAVRTVAEISTLHPAVRGFWAAVSAAFGVILLFWPTLFVLRVLGFLALSTYAVFELIKAFQTRKVLAWARRHLNLQ